MYSSSGNIHKARFEWLVSGKPEESQVQKEKAKEM